MNRCPVCMFPNLPYAAADYHICPCCGTEFGNDDADQTHAALRETWLAQGALWFFGNPPANWNPIQQLLNAGVNYAAPNTTMRPSERIFVATNKFGNFRFELDDTSESSDEVVAL